MQKINIHADGKRAVISDKIYSLKVTKPGIQQVADSLKNRHVKVIETIRMENIKCLR